MKRFAGVRKGKVVIVSDVPILTAGDVELLEVPRKFADVSSIELIRNFKVKNGKLINKLETKSAKELKIAFVGNWKMQCGISTYSESLWPLIDTMVGESRFFIEKNDSPTSETNDERFIECWTRGESLQELVTKIKEYDPDIISIQHEFGLWPNARYWLSMMSQLSNYRVVVTMHSVFHHKDKTITEACMPEIVVHLRGAYEVLKDEKGITSPVHVISHGCHPVDNTRLWNYYKSEQTFLQFGFGFRYKGFETSIRAVALLKAKYPDVFFTAIFTESSHNAIEHETYYNELVELIDSLDVKENVSIVRGYQSDQVLDSFIRTNKVVVLPYKSNPGHEVFGVSGAARYAMAKGVPVVTTSVNHFSDVPTVKADTPESIAAELDRLFSSDKVREEQIRVQSNYIEENSWQHIAERYVGLFVGKPTNHK